jgi:hypothetical protein
VGDGTTWRRSDDAALADGSIRPVAVSCPTASFCVAVGEGTDPAGAALRQYDGQRWRAVDLSGITEPGPSQALSDVSCPTPTACVAVGDRTALRWDGRTWSPAPPAEGAVIASRVSCWAPGRCIGVLSGFPGYPVTNISRWDGSMWTGVHQAQGVFLFDVSCAREGACVAVGFRATPPAGPVALRQTATGWREEAVTGGGTTLLRVSCTADAGCVALGTNRLELGPIAGATAATVSVSPGSWAGTAPPPPPLGLIALDCVGRTCTTVGGVEPPGSDRKAATAARLTR